MKKVIVTLGIIIGIAFILLVLLNVNQYSLDAIVTDRANDGMLIIKDVTGNVWKYKDIQNEYVTGDNIKITWNDKGTEIKQDDEIVKLEIK